MKRTHAYLIAEKLYFNSISNPLCNRSWLFAIYKSLLVSNSNDTEEIKWTKHNQWKIDHNCRAAKASARKEGIFLSTFNLTIKNDNVAELKVAFSNKDLKTVHISGIYERSSFINSLWEFKNPREETILNGEYERDQLFDSSIYSFDEIEEEDETYSSKKLDAKNKKRGKKANEEHIREMKFTALNVLLDQIRDPYRQTTELIQRSFLETVVGAAIFYLPSFNTHFNGFISVNALKGYLKGERRVKDHIYPRKLAARELLSKKMAFEELIDRYHNHLATYMYITSSENSYLINFYESHNNHDEAMKALGIEKFPTNEKEKFESHKELNKFLEEIDSKVAQKMTKEELMVLLREFRGK